MKLPSDLGVSSPPGHPCTTEPGTGTRKGVRNGHQWVHAGRGGSAILTYTPTAARGGTGAEKFCRDPQVHHKLLGYCCHQPRDQLHLGNPRWKSAPSQTTKPSPQQ